MDALAEARDRLLKEDAKFQRLARKHEGFEVRLAALRAKRFATADEKQEESSLKRQKLAVKDEMERILRECGE